MYTFSPDVCHEEYLKEHRPLLAFHPDAEYAEWKKKIRECFAELMGDDPVAVEANTVLEWEKETKEYTERRIVFDTEPFASVPCHLLIPKKGKPPYPLVVCLQGHATGMHVSLGRAVYEGDEEDIRDGSGLFALQAVREGYAALVLEQRGFGERKCAREKYLWKSCTCEHPAMVALLMGRTLLRERAWDVSRALDVVSGFPEIDMTRIGIMGNSGGGTATYYTACLESRIRVAMPSSSICAFERSIIMRRHCDCNYVPRMAKYMDMGEMACMIAPRPLIIVAGEQDPSFRIDGTEKIFEVVRQIYEKEGVPENCRLIKGPKGHQFYPELAWPVFRELLLGKKEAPEKV